MEPEDKDAVLVAVAHAPGLAIRVGLQYLRMKRSANKARGRFYRELVHGGMPVEQAKILADEYASAASIRSLMKAFASGRVWADW